MKEFIINRNSTGQRLDRYIKKLMPNISTSLIQKSIRKKNITVNGVKAQSNKLLKEKDTVQIFFSDETIHKFQAERETRNISPENLELLRRPAYEDENFVAINKPVGLLSQPDSSNTISVSDIVTSVLKNDHSTFSPAPLNRLDRNTSGLIIIPKNYQSQKLAAKAIREHQSQKLYLTLVSGRIINDGSLTNSYTKDKTKNLAVLSGSEEIKLNYRVLAYTDDLTLLEVELITGKSHQIRAQFKDAGFPLIGDPKYGNKKINEKFKSKYNLDNQLLHAYQYTLKDNDQIILKAEAELPELFKNILEKEFKTAQWLTGKNNII